MAVVGLVLQFADAFPEHREERKTVVIISLGVFLGVAASTFSKAQYNITGNVDARYLLLFALVAATAAFALLAALAGTEAKRDTAGVAAMGFGGVFLISGMAIGIGSVERDPYLSVDETLLLATASEQQQDFDRATDLLKTLYARLDGEREATLTKRIEQIELKQASKIK